MNFSTCLWCCPPSLDPVASHAPRPNSIYLTLKLPYEPGAQDAGWASTPEFLSYSTVSSSGLFLLLLFCPSSFSTVITRRLVIVVGPLMIPASSWHMAELTSKSLVPGATLPILDRLHRRRSTAALPATPQCSVHLHPTIIHSFLSVGMGTRVN